MLGGGLGWQAVAGRLQLRTDEQPPGSRMGTDAAWTDLMQRPRLIDVNQRFVVLPARAVTDTQVSHRAFRTLALLALNADQLGHCTRTVQDIEELIPEAARDARLLEAKRLIEPLTSNQHRIIYHPASEDQSMGIKHKELEIDLSSIIKPVVRQRTVKREMPADGQTAAVKRIRKGVKLAQTLQNTSKSLEGIRTVDTSNELQAKKKAMSMSVQERQDSDLVTQAIGMIGGMYRIEGIDKDEAALRLEAERLVASGWTPPASGS